MTDKIKTVHQAALGFVHTLQPGDRGAVVSFSDGVEVLQPLTADIASLERAVQSTQPRGATALNNAIYVALKEFSRIGKQVGEVRRQAIAVLSDGDDTASLISFEDVLAEAKKSGVGIYTISLRDGTGKSRQPSTFSTGLYSMRALAQETGGQAFFPAAVADLSGVYARIADDLENQYSIGYSPKNRRADGRFRRVVVKVVTRPDLRSRARTGYFAERRASASSAPVDTARLGWQP
jgi:Ca-activated chloride channel family protein